MTRTSAAARRIRTWHLLTAVWAATGAMAAAQHSVRHFAIDSAASHVVLHVDKSGVFSFLGHAHEIDAPVLRGSIDLDAGDPAKSQVQVTFDATALRVTGRGEPAGDVPQVQQTMESDRVLDVRRFPTIEFVSRRVDVAQRDGDHLKLRIDGALTMHGVTHPLSTTVDVTLGAERIDAAGAMTVKQTDFGIKPVTAGAGSVRVKDDVIIDFDFVGRIGDGG